ncbi:hypothetical protein L596_008482 [Steinernema carpocapsae]|uniref:Protein kinase domain-containing protein n=1 Tax=Steinernema carpocapsae TaxID=34508 RepID=A0A4U5PCS1_STECR|nr:hypothetical protein L596_008482 [Steinernema carpocapsae]
MTQRKTHELPSPKKTSAVVFELPSVSDDFKNSPKEAGGVSERAMLSAGSTSVHVSAFAISTVSDEANANKIARYDDSFCEVAVDVVPDANGNQRPPSSLSTTPSIRSSTREALTNTISSISTQFGSCFVPIIHKVWGAKHQSAISDSAESTYSDEHTSLRIPYKHLDFTLTDWIGSGTEGAVFLGRYNDRDVAIKRMNVEVNLAGIKRLKELNDPNIVEYIGVAQEGPDMQRYIIMEYCSNGQLFNVLGKRDVTKNLFLQWSMQIASGMDKFHSAFKLIHRDLKTLNILVDQCDNVKICDCEGHKESDKKSQMMSMRGTTAWMAPEYIRGENCTEKVDVWSYGVVFWEIMTQQRPYYGIESQAVMFKVGRGELQLHIPHSSPATASLIMKQCWSQTPTHRPSFKYIIQLLHNLKEELNPVSDDMWRMRKEAWKKDIERQRLGSVEDTGRQMRAYKLEEEDDLVKQRIRELQHSQELRKTYEDKLKRVDLLYEILMKERAKAQLEQENTLRMSKYRVERHMQLNSRGSTVSSELAGRGARVFVQRDSYDSSEDEDFNVSYSRESPYRNANMNLPKSSSSRFSRESSVRSIASASDRGRRSTSSVKISPSIVADRAVSYTTPLHRGSPVRVSGISTDSGLPSERLSDFGGSSYALEVEKNNASVQTDAPIYRNTEGRYSDTKIAVQQRRKPRKASICGTPTFMRNSPSRPVRRQDSSKRLTYPNPQLVGISLDDVQIEIDLPQPLSSERGHRRSTSMVESSIRNGNIWTEEVEATPSSTVETATKPMEHHFRNCYPQIDLSLSIVSSQDNECNEDQNHCSDASAENSSDDEKNMESVSARDANGELFESSLDSSMAGATFGKRSSLNSDQSCESDRCSQSMASSVISWGAVERSLEKGIERSDGLSDREATIRNSFRIKSSYPQKGALPRVEDEYYDNVSSDNKTHPGGESYC